jgi:hypothetical protein
MALLAPLAAWSQVSLSITVAPPALPVYAQPLVPGDGYIWTPGYWSWNAPDGDYYWVPGTWVMAPGVGQLWTPGYWGYEDSFYIWHGGYWGTSVGYYGGLNYGYGYSGSGYQGGRWDHGGFQYNRAASNVNGSVVHAIYNARVVQGGPTSRASYNGGPAGTHARPTGAKNETAAASRAGPTAEQQAHERLALTTPTQRAAQSHGAPAIAATPRPSSFTGAGVEPARAKAEARPPAPVAARREPQAARPVVSRAEPERREAPQAAERPQRPAEPQRAEREPNREESRQR